MKNFGKSGGSGGSGSDGGGSGSGWKIGASTSLLEPCVLDSTSDYFISKYP